MQLSEKNIPAISKTINCPRYDRSLLKMGIVHVGVGGFHRSHQAYYMHQLLQRHGVTDWAICGVGLRAADRKMADVMQTQDGLYTLITQHPDGSADTEVVGSINAYLFAPDDPQLVIDRMAHADTKIVSLTITEGGYNFDVTTGAFDFDHPDVKHDLDHPDDPKTVYGFLVSALRNRRDRELPPFTVLSCDNILHNGDVARQMTLAYARRVDPHLAEWIAEQVAFPNTMVDRITPVTTPENINYLSNEHGIADEWPVVCEPYIQWVIEDRFSNGRPPLEKLGVQFVPDVTPYEKMKIRLLNAGHSVLGIPGAIHGHPTIDACMKDDVFAQFMRRFMDVEATPILGTIAGIDLEKYKDSLEDRFANPNIKDSVSRICSESSAKLPKFLIPTIVENLNNDGSIKYATFILAAWCMYSDKGKNEKGDVLEIIDEQKTQLRQSAQKTSSDWTAFLNQPTIFGQLIHQERFRKTYTDMIQLMYQTNNIRKLMSDLLK